MNLVQLLYGHEEVDIPMTENSKLIWIPPQVAVTQEGGDLILQNPIPLVDYPANKRLIWRTVDYSPGTGPEASEMVALSPREEQGG